MLLVLNTIQGIEARNHFDQIVLPRITKSSNIKYHVLHLGQTTPDLSPYSHLLLTGSELSASKENPEDSQIYHVIKSFLKMKKPILGICHGHQMLAKTLADKDVCKRASNPEFGWIKMTIENNPIFEGIKEPIFLNSHYDEITNLPATFKVLAKTEDCQVQAFQYNDLPLWGLQFHPEMLAEDGNPMVDNHLEQVIEDRAFYHNDLQSADQLHQNLLIFENFFKTRSY